MWGFSWGFFVIKKYFLKAPYTLFNFYTQLSLFSMLFIGLMLSLAISIQACDAIIKSSLTTWKCLIRLCYMPIQHLPAGSGFIPDTSFRNFFLPPHYFLYRFVIPFLYNLYDSSRYVSSLWNNTFYHIFANERPIFFCLNFISYIVIFIKGIMLLA